MRKIATLCLTAILLAGLFHAPAPRALAAGTTAVGLTMADKVQALKKAGIMTGDSQGRIQLDEPVSREQFAMVLYRLWRLQMAAGSSYSDVPTARWSAPFIESVTKAGLMKGVQNGKFAPNQKLTVEQLASAIVRPLDADGTQAAGSSPAVKGTVSTWAKADVAEAIARGLLLSQADYKRTALRQDLVDASYAFYQQYYTPTAVSVVQITGTDRVSVKFTDGVTQEYTLSKPLSYDKTVPVHVRYQGKPFIIPVTLQTGQGTGTSTGEGSPTNGTSTGSGSATGSTAGGSGTIGGTGGTGGSTSGSGSQGTQTGNNGSSAGSGTDNKATGIYFDSVEAVANSQIRIRLFQPVSTLQNASFRIQDVYGNELAIRSTRLTDDGATVWITTDEQAPGRMYLVMSGDEALSFTAAALDKIKPEILAAVVNPNATILITFNEYIDPVTAANPTNYSIRGAQVYKSELNPDGKSVTLSVTGLVRNVTYVLTVQNVADLSGNVMLTRANLTLVGIVDTVKPTLLSIVNNVDGSLTLTFSEPLKRETVQPGSFMADQGLSFTSALLQKDNVTVTLQTTKQTTGKLYNMTILGVTDLNGNPLDKESYQFGGAVDIDKPKVVSVYTYQASGLRVVFNEKVTRETAENVTNYKLDQGLQVTKALLDKDGLTVNLVTGKQSLGSIYHAEISGVNDLSGNIMDIAANLPFAGRVDNDPPKVVTVIGGANLIAITFDEKVNKASAEDLSHYELDSSAGTISQAFYNDTLRMVTLRTSSLSFGKQYTLRLKGVSDTEGNAMKETTQTFIGGAMSPLVLLSAQSVTGSSIELLFDQELNAADIAAMKVEVSAQLSDPALRVPLAGTVMAEADKKRVLVKFAGISGTASTTLFRQGYLYNAKVTGPSGLLTQGDANIKAFAGTYAVTRPPYIREVREGDNSTLTVTFSEPVKNIRYSSFSIVGDNGAAIPLVGDSVNGSDQPFTTVQLYMGTETAAGRVYSLYVLPGMTDATGSVAAQAAEPVAGSKTSATDPIKFAGTHSTNLAPYMQYAAASDTRNFTIYFSEPVITAAANFTLTNLADMTSVALSPSSGAAVFTPSQDRMQLKVRLTGSTLLQEGKVYKLTYNKSVGGITDLQGKVYDPTAGKNEIVMAGTGQQSERPYITDVYVSGNQMIVVWNEAISGFSGAGMLDITLDGKPVTPLSAVLTGTEIHLTIPELPPGKTGTVRVNASGAASIIDDNGQAPDTARSVIYATR